MKNVLQKYMVDFGKNFTNTFDLDFWHRYTNLTHVQLEIKIKKGTIDSQLNHCDSGYKNKLYELTSLSQLKLSHTKKYPLDTFKAGFFQLSVNPLDKSSEYSLNFVTEDLPNTKTNICFLLLNQDTSFNLNKQIEEIISAFTHLGDNFSYHLSIVSNSPVKNIEANDSISIFNKDGLGSNKALGLGLYEILHGSLKNKEFTAVCILEDKLFLSQEMMERLFIAYSYKKNNVFFGVAVSPSFSLFTPTKAESSYLNLGYKYTNTPTPFDKPLGEFIQANDYRNLLTIDKSPDYCTGLLCVDIKDMADINLPYPLYKELNLLDLCLRLKNKGLRLAISPTIVGIQRNNPGSLNPKYLYYRFRNRLFMQAIDRKLNKNDLFKSAIKLTLDSIRQRRYEQATIIIKAVKDFLKGIDFNINNYKKIEAELDAIVQAEKPVHMPLIPPGYKVLTSESPYRNIWTKRLFEYSLWGHFCPLMQKLALDSDFRGDLSCVRKSQRIIYFDIRSKFGQSLKRKELSALRILLKLFFLTLKKTKFNWAQKEIEKAHTKYLTADFWSNFSAKNKNKKKQSHCDQKPVPRYPRQSTALTDRDQVFINSIRNLHYGKRCFIVGNGPSLKIADLDKLNSEYSLASNKIYLAFDSTPWRPSLYSVEDTLVAFNNHDEIVNIAGCTKIFPAHLLSYLPRTANHFFINSFSSISSATAQHGFASKDSFIRNFSRDLSFGVYWGSTITYSLMQMAVHMGFKKIYLIGVDHYYEEPTEKLAGNMLVSENEQNHFHPDYRKPGELWHSPNIARLETSYQYAYDYCSKIGVKVYNASRKTALDVFPQVNFEDII